MTPRRPTPEALAAKCAPAPERDDRMRAEHHAAAESSGLPGVKRHRGRVLPDWAPERWEVEHEGA